MASLSRNRRSVRDPFVHSVEQLSDGDFVGFSRLQHHRAKFCELFSEYAPEAWEALLKLESRAFGLYLAWRVPAARVTPKGMDSILKDVNGAIDVWARRFRLISAGRWIEDMALSTLLASIENERNGLPAPKSLTMLPGSSGFWFEPQSEVRFELSATSHIWNRTASTWSEFKKQVLQEVGEQLDQLGHEALGDDLGVISPRINDPAQHDREVIWTIQAFTQNLSPAAIGESAGVTRQRVDQGVTSVAADLGLDWSAVKRARDRSTWKRSQKN